MISKKSTTLLTLGFTFAALTYALFPNKYERADIIEHTVKQGENVWQYFKTEAPDADNFRLYQQAVYQMNKHKWINGIDKPVFWGENGLEIIANQKIDLPDVDKSKHVGSKITNNYSHAQR